MSRVEILVLVSVCCMLCGYANAQQVSCANATQMQNVNLSQLIGTWYEVARSPGLSNMGCVELDLSVYSVNKTLGVKITYVDPTQSKWINSTASANITLDADNTKGYNVSMGMAGSMPQNTTLKLLDTDYNHYAIVCGYTNATNASTAFGAILTRVRMPLAVNLTNYETMASKNFTNFSNMTNTTQSDKCYRSSASAPLPMIVTTFAAIYALFKFIV